jgi:DNA-directed RNA polymerase subunit E'/Rpb7
MSKTQAAPMVYTPLYREMLLKKRIRLEPSENERSRPDEVLKHYLKRTMGNKCTKEGFIKKESIEIVQRSIGVLNTRFLDGSVSYNVTYRAEVCCPKEEDIMEMEVVDINKMGILAKKEDSPLNVVIPKQIHPDKTLYKQLQDAGENQKIAVQVVGTRFERNSKEIFVIGKLIEIL